LQTYVFKRVFRVEVYEADEFSESLLFDAEDFSIYLIPFKPWNNRQWILFTDKPIRKINLEYTKKFGLEKHPLLGKLQEGEDIEYNGKKILASKATYLDEPRKLTYISDTKYFDKLIDYAKNSDLLISEATFSKKDEDKCKDYNHMSSAMSAIIAKKAKAKQLIITHISQRYLSSKPLEDEAKEIFKNTIYAQDFMEYTVK
jgi:ribonuclease Z